MTKTRYIIRGRNRRTCDWEALYSPSQDVSLEDVNKRFNSLKTMGEILQTYSEFELEVVKSEVIRKGTCVLELREETSDAT